MMRSILAAASVAVVACTQPLEPGSLRVDPEPDLLPHVVDAADRLEQATGIVVHVGEGAADLAVPALLVPSDALQPDPDQVPESGHELAWAGHFDGQVIRINRDAFADARGRVVLHELLHATLLESGHIAEPGHVLSEVAGPCLTAADLERVCGRVDCGWMQPECELAAAE